jgi:hypothetical protein
MWSTDLDQLTTQVSQMVNDIRDAEALLFQYYMLRMASFGLLTVEESNERQIGRGPRASKRGFFAGSPEQLLQHCDGVVEHSLQFST